MKIMHVTLFVSVIQSCLQNLILFVLTPTTVTGADLAAQQHADNCIKSEVNASTDSDATSLFQKQVKVSHMRKEKTGSARIPGIKEKDNWPDWRAGDKVPLFFFPGFGGNSEWLGLMEKNLKSLQKQIGSFDCIIFQYKTAKFDGQRVKPCRIMDNHINEGHLWTFWMQQVSRQDIESHSHVAFLLENVDISQVDVEKQLRIMTFYNATVSSPAFDEGRGSPYHHDIMRRNNAAKIGRLVTYIDPQFMIFTPEKYTCWQNMIDSKINSVGWGYDRMLHSVCDARMVILDQIGIGHHMGRGSSYDFSKAKHQELEFMTKYTKLGYEAVPSQDAILDNGHDSTGEFLT